MKEKELRAAAICANCAKPFGHSRSPLFWRVTLQRFGVRADRIKRQDGLGAMLGSTFLAAVMGPDEDMAEPVMEAKTLTLCEPCSLQPLVVQVLAEEVKPQTIRYAAGDAEERVRQLRESIE